MFHQLHMLDLVSCGAVISACEKGKQWRGGLRMLPEACRQELTLDVVSYNAVTAAFEKVNKLEGAVELLLLMII